MSSRTLKKPSKKACYNWLMFPQVSVRGSPYKIGDPTPGSAWATSYTPCEEHMLSFYGNSIMKPLQILQFVQNAGLRNDTLVQNIENTLVDYETFLKYLSSTIVAYGILLSQEHKSLFSKPIGMLKQELQEFYEEIYNMYLTKNSLSEEELEPIVEPENFLKLNDPLFRDRLKRPKPTVRLPDDVCIADENKECVAAFNSIPKEAVLYPLANSIKCFCNLLRTHVTIVDVSQIDDPIQINYHFRDINKVSEQDFKNISFDLSNQVIVEPFDTVDIELKSQENCVNNPMFYLNQIKEKYFDPYFLHNRKNHQQLDLIFKSNIRQLRTLYNQTTREREYIMDPPFIIKFYKLNDEKQKIYDKVIGPGPIVNLFDDIAQELITSNIFISKESIFGTERYVINPSKKYDFDYIGRLFRFLLINRIRIPYKLSRAYICKLFGLCKFDSNTKNIYEQLILITIYMLETGTDFKKLIVQIFQNPELLNNETFCENSGVFSYPAHMNDYGDIVSEDREIYNNDENVLLYNMVQFLYRNAIKEYFDNENSIEFFKHFGEVQMFKDYVDNIGWSGASYNTLAFPIPKLDIYISGAAISMDDIKNILIPKIQIHIKPTASKQQLNRHYELLIEVLINSTNYFSNTFKEAYDRTFEPSVSLSPEQYHLEFVKYLLKFWTGSSHISELYYYGIQLLPGSPRTNIEFLLPKAATCSQQLKLIKRYETVESLYEDLVSSIIESNFGKEFGLL